MAHNCVRFHLVLLAFDDLLIGRKFIIRSSPVPRQRTCQRVNSAYIVALAGKETQGLHGSESRADKYCKHIVSLARAIAAKEACILRYAWLQFLLDVERIVVGACFGLAKTKEKLSCLEVPSQLISPSRSGRRSISKRATKIAAYPKQRPNVAPGLRWTSPTAAVI